MKKRYRDSATNAGRICPTHVNRTRYTNNSSNEITIDSYPDVYQIDLDHYESRRSSQQYQQNDVQKITQDDLPSYEQIISSAKFNKEKVSN